MNTIIKIFGKSLFGNIFLIGLMSDPDFIIPENGDIICISENQIRVWNGGYTDIPLKVLYKQYNYSQISGGEKICNIIIYVKPVKN